MHEEKELEVKLAIRDPEVARRVLTSHGFEYEDTCLEVDIYYAHPCRDFVKTDEALRFRTRKCNASSHYAVSYKGPRERGITGLKIRTELEIVVDELAWTTLRSIMEKLGFKPIAEFAKMRELYKAPRMKATLDTLFGVGFFLEVELDRMEDVTKLNDLLGKIERNTAISTIDKTYLEICLETGKCRPRVE